MTDPTTPQPSGDQQPVQYVYVQQQNRPTDPWSIVSLIFGCLSVAGGWCCFGLPGFVALAAGGVHFAVVNPEEKGGRGMAIAGLVLGALTAVPWLVLGIAGVGGGITDYINDR